MVEAGHRQDTTSPFCTSMLPHPQLQWRPLGCGGGVVVAGPCPRPPGDTSRLLPSPKGVEWPDAAELLQALPQDQCPLEGSGDMGRAVDSHHHIHPLHHFSSSPRARGGHGLVVAGACCWLATPQTRPGFWTKDQNQCWRDGWMNERHRWANAGIARVWSERLFHRNQLVLVGTVRNWSPSLAVALFASGNPFACGLSPPLS